MNTLTETFLTARGFKQLPGLTGPQKDKEGWMRCIALPDIYILLDPDASPDCAIEAIFQAGINHHARLVRDQYKSLQDLYSRAIPLPPEAEQLRTDYMRQQAAIPTS